MHRTRLQVFIVVLILATLLSVMPGVFAQETTEEPAVPTTEPTAEPTDVPTEVATEEPTEAPTEAATEEPTEAPTEAETEAATEEPTEAATEEATDPPPVEVTDEPTAEEPTEDPTAEPEVTPEVTEEPTGEATEEPTVAPTEAPGDDYVTLPPGFGPPGMFTGQRGVDPAIAGPRSLYANSDIARVIVVLNMARGAGVPEPDREAGIGYSTSAIQMAQSNLINTMAGYNVSVIQNYSHMPLMALEVDATALSYIQNTALVTAWQYDELNYTTLDQSVDFMQASPGQTGGHDGTGQYVAVLDNGFDLDHPFLDDQIVAEACFGTNGEVYVGGGQFITSQSNCPSPDGFGDQTGSGSASYVTCYNRNATAGYDQLGNRVRENCDHGSHVAGIVAGDDGVGGVSFTGVAPDANLIVINVFSHFNEDFYSNPGTQTIVSAWDSDIIAALNYVYSLRFTYDIASVNLSLGGGLYSSPCDATKGTYKSVFDDLRSAGIAPIVASGNNGSVTQIASPACVTSAFSVGAVRNAQDIVALYSNAAYFLDFLAPGGDLSSDSGIESSIPSGSSGYTYAGFQGTSMAAPHVAGAWALMRERFPNATLNQITDALRSSATPVQDINGVFRSIKVGAAIDRGILDLNSPVSGADQTVNTVSFKWDHVTDATWYQVWVSPAGGTPTTVWVKVGFDVACSTECTAEINVPAGTGNVTHQWWVQAYREAEGVETAPYYGLWIGPETFDVLGAAGLLPSGSIAPSDGKVTFTWAGVGSIATYELWVNNGDGTYFNEDITATCGGGQCSYEPDTPFPTDDYTWWVRAISGGATGNWSAAKTFDTSVPPPETPTNVDESVSQSSAIATLYWDKMDRATWYRVEIRKGSQTGTQVHYEWYELGDLQSTSSQYFTSVALGQTGTYYWRVLSWSPDGSSDWTSWRSMTVNAIAPVTSIDTVETISEARGDFTYEFNRPDDRVTWYKLWIANKTSGTTVIHDMWYEVGVTPGMTCISNSCTVDPGLILNNGSYEVWVYSWAPIGAVWNADADKLAFTLNLAAPAEVDSGFGTSGWTDQPTLKWDDVAGASWYYVWLNNQDGVNVFKGWVVRDDVCSNGDCEFAPTDYMFLDEGNSHWWVRPYGPGGYGPWSDEQTYNIPNMFGPTPTPQGLAVTNTDTMTPTFTWTNNGALRYELWVSYGSSKVYSMWVRKGEAGCAPTCSYTPNIELTNNGSYTVWVRGDNPHSTSGWSAGLGFTINLALPTAPTLTSPTGGTVASPVTFTWTDVPAATWYWVEIDGAGTWYTDEQANCVSTCSITRSLSNGAHSWRVRGWNASGNGSFSTTANFNVGSP